MKTRLKTIAHRSLHDFSLRRLAAVLLGNLLLGWGCAGLKLSLMGNDAFTAAMMAFSDGLGIGQGNLQLTVNCLLFLIELAWGYRYIGLGTLVNMGLLGYVVQFSVPVLRGIFGSGEGHSLGWCLMYMAAAYMVVAFGLSMYQKADMGISPFDYLAIGMTERFHRPYFINRMITDGSCVVAILAAAASGFISWENSHLGIATIVGAFCLGPFVSFWDRINGRWIR